MAKGGRKTKCSDLKCELSLAWFAYLKELSKDHYLKDGLVVLSRLLKFSFHWLLKQLASHH